MKSRTKLKDRIGQKFNLLTVIAVSDEKVKNSSNKVVCKCDCGKEITCMIGNIARGATKSCGHLYLTDRKRGPKIFYNLGGKKYPMKTVEKLLGVDGTTIRYWLKRGYTLEQIQNKEYLKEKSIARTFAQRVGITSSAVYFRLNHGWTIKKNEDGTITMTRKKKKQSQTV
jgi:hypothetical protein